jgi:hypothetical protein
MAKNTHPEVEAMTFFERGYLTKKFHPVSQWPGIRGLGLSTSRNLLARC